MKQTITDFGKFCFEFSNKFGLIIIATIISMVARAIYKGSSVKRLLLKIPISAIIGIVVAVILHEYTDASANVTVISCTIVGAYTGEVLDGVEQLVRWIPDFIKKVFNSKFNIDENSNEKDNF